MKAKFDNDVLKSEKFHIERGKSYLERKEYKKSEMEFKKAIRINPESEDAHFELGKVYYMQKQYHFAIEELEKTKKMNPQNNNTYLFLAKIYKITRKFDLALEEIKHVLNDSQLSFETKKELNDIYPEYINGIRSYNFRGNYEKVREKAEEIYGLIPQDDIFSRNKLLSELEIAQKKLILSSKMKNLIVTLSTRCNLNCTMCEEIRIRWEIPKRTLQEIISFFPYLERVVWQGGEVFLLNYFADLVNDASKFPNLRQVITTNGLLIDRKWAEKLVKSNVDLTFSIDGLTKQVYEGIRKGAKFETLIRNLRYFNKLRKQYAPLLNINLHVVVMKSNYHQLEEFIDFAKEYEFKLLALLPIGGNLDSPENIFYFKDEKALSFIEKTIPRIKEKAEKYGILLENRLPVTKKENLPNASKTTPIITNNTNFNNKMLCHLPWIQLFIDYDGSIRPDCVCRPEESIGNVLENSLAEVWNNEKMQLYRKKIIDNCCNEICNSECTEDRVSERYLKFS